MELPKDGPPRADTSSVERTLTHQSGWVFNHCNCSILYKRLNIVYKTYSPLPCRLLWTSGGSWICYSGHQSGRSWHYPHFHSAAKIPALASTHLHLNPLSMLALKAEAVGMSERSLLTHLVVRTLDVDSPLKWCPAGEDLLLLSRRAHSVGLAFTNCPSL